MKMSKQRWIVVGSMTLLLVAACVLNYRLNMNADPLGVDNPSATGTAVPAGNMDGQNGSSADGTVETAGFFSQYKLDRDQKRADEVKYLDEVLADGTTEQSTRNEAQKLKVSLAAAMEKELTVETLLRAQGFEHAAVVFHEEAVNVIVGKKELSEAEVATILSIVIQETSQSAENVKIIPVG